MVLSFRLAAMGLLALASAQEVSCLRSARIIFRTNDPHSTLAPSPKKMIVTFLNELPDETVKLYWLDHDNGGTRHEAGTVPPRGTRFENCLPRVHDTPRNDPIR